MKMYKCINDNINYLFDFLILSNTDEKFVLKKFFEKFNDHCSIENIVENNCGFTIAVNRCAWTRSKGT